MVTLKLFRFTLGKGNSIKSKAVTVECSPEKAQRIVQQYYDGVDTGVHEDTLKRYPVRH